jgi:hypothetical protein
MTDQEETRETVAEFIARVGITAKVVLIKKRPDRAAADQWDASASHWRITFRRGNWHGIRMTVYYSMGSAHTSPPAAVDVLQCLADDAAGWENTKDFESWAPDYGYDTDSRKAFAIFNAVQKQAHRLESFLGNEEYERLLWHTGRE